MLFGLKDGVDKAIREEQRSFRKLDNVLTNFSFLG